MYVVAFDSEKKKNSTHLNAFYKQKKKRKMEFN